MSASEFDNYFRPLLIIYWLCERKHIWDVLSVSGAAVSAIKLMEL